MKWSVLVLAFVVSTIAPTTCVQAENILDSMIKKFGEGELNASESFLGKFADSMAEIDLNELDAAIRSDRLEFIIDKLLQLNRTKQLHIRNASVSGMLNLPYRKIGFPIGFTKCKVKDGLASKACEVGSLRFYGCELGKIQISEAIQIDNLVIYGGSIKSLNLDSSRIRILKLRNCSSGPISMIGTEVSQWAQILNVSESVNGISLDARKCSVGHFIIEFTNFKSGINFSAANFGDLTVNEGEISFSKNVANDVALNLEGVTARHIRIGSTNRDVKVIGAVSLAASACKIVSLGGHFEASSSGLAISANGGMFDRIMIRGKVVGKLMCVESQVKRDFTLFRGTTIESGEINIKGCKIGRIQASDVKFSQKLDEVSKVLKPLWDASSVIVEQDVSINGSVFKNGTVFFNGSTVGGGIYLNKTEFEHSRFHCINLRANTFCLTNSCLQDSLFSLGEATIHRELRLVGIENSPDSFSLVDLERATAGVYHDSNVGENQEITKVLGLNGFEYGALSSGADLNVSNRKEWIRNSRKLNGQQLTSSNFHDNLRYSTQPYEQLASEYDRIGQASNANSIRFAMNWDKEFESKFSWNYLKHWLLFLLVGFGYCPWLPLLWSVVLIVAGRFVYKREKMHPLKDDEKDTDRLYSPLAFSCDVFIPLTDFYQSSTWYPKKKYKWVYGFMYLQIVAGFILSALFAASIAGLLK